MVKVEKFDKKDFIQCSSCLKSTEEIDVFKIEMGKTPNQTSSFKLCYKCLCDLGCQIIGIQAQENCVNKNIKKISNETSPLYF